MQFSSLLLSVLATTSAFLSSASAISPLQPEIVAEFPPGFFLENLAVRRNGQILATVASTAQVYQIDPCKTKRVPLLIYSFPADRVAGIAELEPDIFYVATANKSADSNPFGSAPGSLAIWKLDLRSFSVRYTDDEEDSQSGANATKIATFPKAQNLNGVAVLNHRKGLLVITDSILGLIWQLNVYTKEIKIFADDPLAKSSPDALLPVGINGIKVRRGAVYFSNSGTGIIARINVKQNEFPTGPATVVVKGLIGPDDFTIGPNGGFFIAEFLNNALGYAPASGGDARIPTKINSNPTSIAFGKGRKPRDARTVYVTSAGGPLEAFATKNPPAGKLLKIDVTPLLDGPGSRGWEGRIMYVWVLCKYIRWWFPHVSCLYPQKGIS